MTFLQGTTDGTIIIQAPNALVFGTGNASSDVYLKEVAGGLSVSQPLVLTSATLSGTISNYGGVATVGNGVPAIVAKADLTAQAANVGVTLLYAIPANGAGTYRISAYAVVTQQASTSSTLPNVQLSYTDFDTSIVKSPFMIVASTATNPAVGASNVDQGMSSNAGTNGTLLVQAKASTNIQYQTVNYASVGATPMQYAIHIKLEYLGA